MRMLFDTKAKSSECFFRLIDAGADVKIRDRKGNTALIYAAGRGQFEYVTALIKAGADVNEYDFNGDTENVYSSS